MSDRAELLRMIVLELCKERGMGAEIREHFMPRFVFPGESGTQWHHRVVEKRYAMRWYIARMG